MYIMTFWQVKNCDSSPCEGDCNTLTRASGHEEVIGDTGLLYYTSEPHVTKDMVSHFGMGLKMYPVLWQASASLCSRLSCTPLEPKKASTKAAAYPPIQNCCMGHKDFEHQTNLVVDRQISCPSQEHTG